MLFAPAPSNPAFQPLLVQDPVLLRAGAVSDYPAWLSLRERSRAHLTEWEESWTPEQATLSAFKRRLRNYDREARRGGGLSLLVFRLSDNVLVGGATLTNIRYGASRSGVLGYWVGAPFTIVAACQPGNIASQKLLERSGFVREGRARDYLKINGAWRDHDIYAITAADHRKAAATLS